MKIRGAGVLSQKVPGLAFVLVFLVAGGVGYQARLLINEAEAANDVVFQQVQTFKSVRPSKAALAATASATTVVPQTDPVSR